MRKTTIILALLSLCLTAVAKSSKTVTIQLIETSDVHGAFFPYNFTERRPMQGTMARVSTYLKRQRQQYGKNVILLDNGDILQGQPTCYYTNFVATDKPNIAAEVINYMQFDAETFGNHDVEPGQDGEALCQALHHHPTGGCSCSRLRYADASYSQLAERGFVDGLALRRNDRLCAQVDEDTERKREG